MKEFPFERAAMNNDPMPHGLNNAEQALFQGLSALYGRLRLGLIDRTSAKREKAAMVRQYNAMEADARRCEQTAALWKDMEGLIARYQAEKTLEHADQCLERLYGIGSW